MLQTIDMNEMDISIEEKNILTVFIVYQAIYCCNTFMGMIHECDGSIL